MISDETRGATPCSRVFDRLVQGGDVAGDPELGEHLGSCIACFRVMSELRDVPRLSAVLRADPPALPESERFWQDLAERTTAAAAAALADQTGPAVVARPARPAIERRWFGRGAIAGLATAAAAAAVLLLAPRRPEPLPARATSGGAEIAPQAPALPDDDPGGTLDFGNLDRAALRRLADRLRARTSGNLTAFVGGDSAYPAGFLADDEEGFDDELADLDVPALRRVESSLAGASQ